MAIEWRPRVLRVAGARAGPAFLPHLTRLLLESPGLEELELSSRRASRGRLLPALLRGASGAQLGALAAALRASPVRRLTLSGVGLWDLPAASLSAVTEALRGHPTISFLDICDNIVRRRGAAQAAVAQELAGLIAADSPALRELDCRVDQGAPSNVGLGEEGLISVFRALRSNSHLEGFACGGGFVYEKSVFSRHGLPAVWACASLKAIGCTGDHVWLWGEDSYHSLGAASDDEDWSGGDGGVGVASDDGDDSDEGGGGGAASGDANATASQPFGEDDEERLTELKTLLSARVEGREVHWWGSPPASPGGTDAAAPPTERSACRPPLPPSAARPARRRSERLLHRTPRGGFGGGDGGTGGAAR